MYCPKCGSTDVKETTGGWYCKNCGYTGEWVFKETTAV